MKRIVLLFLLLILILNLSSCKSTDEPNSTVPRTILVYMVAANSLGSGGYDTKDINEMKTAIKNNGLNGCRLLIYYSTYSSSTLIELKGSDGNVETKTLKEYSTSIKSTTKERMQEVINDVSQLSPSDDYGLVLWSHSDGWARSISYSKSQLRNKYFAYPETEEFMIRDYGNDNGDTMPIDVLADAIPSGMFSFIYCDACYMGSLEIAYQFRNKIHYFIGSPTILPGNGMPYDLNLSLFCKSSPDLVGACENTYNYYNILSGQERSLTISLVDCSKLDDLAEVCKPIFASANPQIDTSDLQNYIRPQNGICIYFDFAQYISKIATATQYENFINKFNNVVLYKATTPTIFLTLDINPDNYCGISSYVLGSGNSTNEEYYKTLDWYKNVINQQ